jgi:exoribonuclease-2
MTETNDNQHRATLQRIARRVMLERGLVPDFPSAAVQQLDAIKGAATSSDSAHRDLRSLLWCSIDNDDSRDLDQLTVAESLPGGAVKILVAIADVDAVVKKGSTTMQERTRRRCIPSRKYSPCSRRSSRPISHR